MNHIEWYSASALKVRLRVRKSVKSGTEKPREGRPALGAVWFRMTRRSGAAYESGRSSTPWTTEKMAVLAGPGATPPCQLALVVQLLSISPVEIHV